ncbi:MAG: PKD domain-containing protein [Bacteroidetes bacterium]|nr:PKD domain-containing protein [Bacteroidota bacterium]
MKSLKIVSAFLLMSIMTSQVILAQNYVSTQPLNKNAILEEFTGVQCPNCPAGHTVMAGILESNPGRAFCVAYHPSNSNFTTPYSGNPDFRRTYPNAFYSTPYCGSSRFMPSSFIQRREWNGEKIQSRTVWVQYADIIMAEASPLNVGMASTYNEVTHMLDVTVEVYFTQTINNTLSIYVTLAENDLVAQQSGGSATYVHKHTFREAFVAQWGDPMNGPTTQGSLLVFEYEFDNTSTGYLMENCELMAFLVDNTTEEVISGVGVHVGEHTMIPPTADFEAEDTTVGLGTSVTFTDMSTGDPTEWEWTFEGGDPASSTLQNPPPVFYNSIGNYSVTLSVSNDAGQNETTKTGYIIVGYPPVTDFEADLTSILEGESIIFTDMSIQDPAAWSWTFEGGDPGTSNDQNPPAITYNTPGDYTVTLVTSNEFGENTMTKEAYIHVGGVGIEEGIDSQRANIYPVPSNGNLYFDFGTDPLQEGALVSITSSDGRIVHSIPLAPGKINFLSLDLSDEPNGIYYVILQDNGFKEVRKIILNK